MKNSKEIRLFDLPIRDKIYRGRGRGQLDIAIHYYPVAGTSSSSFPFHIYSTPAALFSTNSIRRKRDYLREETGLIHILKRI